MIHVFKKNCYGNKVCIGMSEIPVYQVFDRITRKYDMQLKRSSTSFSKKSSKKTSSYSDIGERHRAGGCTPGCGGPKLMITKEDCTYSNPMSSCGSNISKPSRTDPNFVSPVYETIKCLYALIDFDGKQTGCTVVTTRLTCFGPTIISTFQYLETQSRSEMLFTSDVNKGKEFKYSRPRDSRFDCNERKIVDNSLSQSTCKTKSTSQSKSYEEVEDLCENPPILPCICDVLCDDDSSKSCQKSQSCEDDDNNGLQGPCECGGDPKAPNCICDGNDEKKDTEKDVLPPCPPGSAIGNIYLRYSLVLN